MNKTGMKNTVAAFSALALAGTVASGVAPAFAQSDTPAGDGLAAVQEGAPRTVAGNGLVQVDSVQGAFSYGQEGVTSNADIVRVFNKAAAALCSSLPNYDAGVPQAPICIGGDVANPLYATVDEIGDQEGVQTQVLACSCASNVAGGGAIANAEVGGVSLESVAKLAEAR